MRAQSGTPTEVDIAIVGAGPVGLAIATQLARLDVSVIVVDRRPPPEQDTLRPQMLVARAGDLSNLARLGVDLSIVSILTARCETSSVSGDLDCQPLAPFDDLPPRSRDLVELGFQRPRGLVPIGRLQLALLEIAQRRGVKLAFRFDVVRLRRHAQRSSLVCSHGRTIVAKLVVIATGAARSLVDDKPIVGATQRMIAGVFAAGDTPLWTRFPVAVRGFTAPARATVLQTPSTGTAVIVGTPVAAPTDEQLHGCFAAASVEGDLAGARLLAPPRPFVTEVSAMARRVIAGDGRAPVVIAGDAAQTGHVFTGQTCFINIALALRLCDELGRSRALVTSKPSTWALAFAAYERASEVGAAILHRASVRHHVGVARA